MLIWWKNIKKLYDFEGDDIWKLLFSRGLAKRTKLANGSFLYQLTIAGVLLLSEKPTILSREHVFVLYDMRVVKQL